MSELKSEGQCLYCKKLFSKQAINRHLQKHLTEKIKENKAGKSFLVKIETNPKWGRTPYFLSLWVDSKATMDDIDSFLRGIWLECCGHMSAFSQVQNKQKRTMWDFFEAQQLLMKGKKVAYEKMMEEANGEIPMNRKIHAVFKKGLKLNYEYDFGSTTSLQLTVVEEFSMSADGPVVLLCRNEPLEIVCDNCGKEPALNICGVCVGYSKRCFCKKCGKQHAKTCPDFLDYAGRLVNSPRMGVCGYDGGSIDKERDGIYFKK